MLTTLGSSHKTAVGGRYVDIFACDCGAIIKARRYNVENGRTKSCGCHRRAMIQKAQTTHGDSRRLAPMAAEYRAYSNMLGRCYRERCSMFPHYGGRGIAVCARWRESYENFLADMGRKPSGAHSLDRIHVDGDYEPGNVKWSSPVEQARNKTNTRWLTFRGETKAMSAWAQETGLPVSALAKRLKIGWSLERALTTPSRGKRG